MMDEQDAKSEKRPRLTTGARLLYLLLFAAISAGFAMLWLCENGYLDLGRVLGVCGFKQRFGLPCPGCGWTHAAQAFVTGHVLDAFSIQPAAAVFCFVAVLIAFFALLFSVFGIDFELPKRLFGSVGARLILISVIIIVAAGWLVTLVRTILDSTKT